MAGTLSEFNWLSLPSPTDSTILTTGKLSVLSPGMTFERNAPVTSEFGR